MAVHIFTDFTDAVQEANLFIYFCAGDSILMRVCFRSWGVIVKYITVEGCLTASMEEDLDETSFVSLEDLH